MANPTPKGTRIPRTIRVPDVINDCLRRESYEKRIDANTIVIRELEDRYRAMYPDFFSGVTELEVRN